MINWLGVTLAFISVSEDMKVMEMLSFMKQTLLKRGNGYADSLEFMD